MAEEQGNGTDGKAGAQIIGEPLRPGAILGSCLPRRGAIANRVLIRAPALPSVLTPDAGGISAISESGAQTIGDQLRPGAILGSCLPRRGAIANRVLIRAPALPSVLAPDAAGFSAGSKSGRRMMGDRLGPG